MVWEGFSREYWKAIWRLCEGCLKVWGGCLEYGKAVWRVWEGFLVGVGRLSGECKEAVWRVYGGYLEPISRLWEAVWRVWQLSRGLCGGC